MNSNLGLTEEQRVLAIEDEYVAAEVSRDEATLRRILDDRFVLNSNRGTTSGKAELIESVLSWNMTGQTITERTVLVDGDTAIVCGTTELSFASEGKEDSRSLLRYTSIYVKRGNEWRYMGLHMARHEAEN
jgi:ketosteroid isomerase-like protein